jgi:hypothetical protein
MTVPPPPTPEPPPKDKISYAESLASSADAGSGKSARAQEVLLQIKHLVARLEELLDCADQLPEGPVDDDAP